MKLNSSDNPVTYGRAKNTKTDLTNLINAALTESQTGMNKGTNSPFPGRTSEKKSRFLFLKDEVGVGNYSLISGNIAGGKGRTIHLKGYKDYGKDLSNLNREAAAIGDIPKVHLSRAEHESGQAFSPLPPFLSFNNNPPSLRTGMFF